MICSLERNDKKNGERKKFKVVIHKNAQKWQHSSNLQLISIMLPYIYRVMWSNINCAALHINYISRLEILSADKIEGRSLFSLLSCFKMFCYKAK